jgi:dTMP kinase
MEQLGPAQFITVEGIEGCGKSTQLRRLAEWLRSRGRDVVTSKEPGHGLIGSAIRAILLDPRHGTLHPWSEALLYLADRIQHLHELIIPNLQAGRWLLCDRHHDSTIAYQGLARGLGRERLDDLLRHVFPEPRPHLTLLLDLDANTSLQRARRRNQASGQGQAEGRFEEMDLAFHQAVRAAFLEIARSDSRRVQVIDASGSEDEVFQAILQVVAARYPHV